VIGKTKSQYLDIRDGVVNGLVNEQVIYLAAQVGDLLRMAYNIQPWAWKYLNEKKELLLPVTLDQRQRV